MAKRFISIIMIVFLLVAQLGEAIAIASMTCFSSERSMVMSEAMHESMQKPMQNAAGQMSEHSQYDVADSKSPMLAQNATNQQSMEHECCQQECDCPLGMLSLAVLMDINIQTISYQTDQQQIDAESRLVFAFIPSQQRPPKPLFNFAA